MGDSKMTGAFGERLARERQVYDLKRNSAYNNINHQALKTEIKNAISDQT